MVQDSNRLKLCWYNLERGTVDSQQNFYFGKYPFIRHFSQCEWILLPGIFCENPESGSVLSEPGNGYFRGLAQGPTHCRALPFPLFQGEAEFLLSAAMLNCFLANICIQRTRSCWENGPWGNFRDIPSWSEVAAALGASQNCGQPRSCCSCFWAALGAGKWLVLYLTQEGDSRESVCCIWNTDCTRQGN